jgi:ankyrin repeat protein
MTSQQGWTPLHWAAKKGHIQVCEALLRVGANVQKKIMPDYYEAHFNFHVDPRDPTIGLTPLHLAAESGHKRVCEILLNAGANVEAKSMVSSSHYI